MEKFDGNSRERPNPTNTENILTIHTFSEKKISTETQYKTIPMLKNNKNITENTRFSTMANILPNVKAPQKNEVKIAASTGVSKPDFVT